MPIGSILGGFIGQQGAQQGGDMAWDAANAANQQDQQEAARGRNALTPWSGSGISAQTKIDRLLGLGNLTQEGNNQGIYWVDPAGAKEAQAEEFKNFQASPDYQWRLDQGSKALERSAAQRGMTLSGAQGQAQQDYGQGAASQEYGNYFNRLQTTATNGMNATDAANRTSAGLVGAGANLLAQGGAMRGSMYSAGANALASGIGHATQNLMTLATYTGSPFSSPSFASGAGAVSNYGGGMMGGGAAADAAAGAEGAGGASSLGGGLALAAV